MVNEVLTSRKVQISVENGTNASGTVKAASRTFSNINPNATAAQMHATAQALGTLMDNTVMGIYYDDKKRLQEVTDNDGEGDGEGGNDD